MTNHLVQHIPSPSFSYSISSGLIDLVRVWRHPWRRGYVGTTSCGGMTIYRKLWVASRSETSISEPGTISDVVPFKVDTGNWSAPYKVDFEPFNVAFPRLTRSSSIGNGLQFLNRHLSSIMFRNKDCLEPLLDFLRAHKHKGHVFRVQNLLRKGIGVHHAGLLPIVKKTVEIFFCRGVIKVDDDEDKEKVVVGYWSAFVWLAGLTALIALLSEYFVDAIEVRIHKFLERAKRSRRSKTIDNDEHQYISEEGEIQRKQVEKLIKHKNLRKVQKMLKNGKDTSGGRDPQAKLGSCLIKLLIESAYVQPPVSQLSDYQQEIRPAFSHRVKTILKEPGYSFCSTVERNTDLVYGGGNVGLMGLVSQAIYDGGRHVLRYLIKH
ncbi:hypothetical protein Syun_025739 [Stephania yunnanensis]|uniref:sucrose synthase n=1 Tax=Stephania yunnanensis TaxID=152371 RepID=A0AAP0F139_9MAGN